MKIGERIVKILKEKNLTQKELADYIGIKQSTISDWKGKGTSPSSEYIYKISEYLDESPYFVLTGKNDINKLTDEEINLINKYNLLTEKNKGKVENFIDERIEEQGKGINIAL
ncbi:MAG: helix-turn-helix transcriptional regulator [Thermoplasmata archaeon]